MEQDADFREIKVQRFKLRTYSFVALSRFNHVRRAESQAWVPRCIAFYLSEWLGPFIHLFCFPVGKMDMMMYIPQGCGEDQIW